MLLGLRVKDFTLIRETSLSFNMGFTVLSGEASAGKSVLIDSISALLGAGTGRDMIRNDEEAACLELIFSVRQKRLREHLVALSIVPEEDGVVTVSRKIQGTRSISWINDKAVTTRQLKKPAALLIGIHGWYKAQTLFSTEMHGRLLDELLSPMGQTVREVYAEVHRAYRQLFRQERGSVDRAVLFREVGLLAPKIRELSESGIHPSGEAELAEAYASAKRAMQAEEALTEVECAPQTDTVSGALRAVRAVVRYAISFEAFAGQLTELGTLAQDTAETARGEQGKIESDGETLNRLGERLGLLRHLEAKYNYDEEGLLRLLRQREACVAAITAFLRSTEAVMQQKESARQMLCVAAAALREFRHRAARNLAMRAETELAALNFKGACFEVRFAGPADFAENAEFYIRTNLGKEVRPFRQIANDGELSRVMFALQTVLAVKNRVETLIFDGTGTDISRRTAQPVLERLMEISQTRQVLCITHPPQLVAMADHHYLIVKKTDGSKTETEIREIVGEALYPELGRLIGDAEITAGVLKTAEEIKQFAERRKEEMR